MTMEKMNTLIEGFDPSKIQQDESERKWKEVMAAYQNDTILQAELVGIEKVGERQCGFVRLGPIKGYIPLEESGYPELNQLRYMSGQALAFKVLNIDKDNDIFIGSRLKALEHMAEITLRRISVGDFIYCVARNVSPSVIRADIGGIEVKIPIEDVSYGWIDDLQDMVRVGDHMKVQVLEIDKDSRKVKVSAKAAQVNPYPECATRYQKRGEYVGKVSGVRDYGVFVNLEPGVDSLAPHLKFEHVKKGDRVLIRVINVDTGKEQIRSRIVRVL